MNESLLQWGKHPRGTADEVVASIFGESGTTLFIYSISLRKLYGAFISDEDEQRKYKDFEEASEAAESYLRAWVIGHRDLIFKIRAQQGGGE